MPSWKKIIVSGSDAVLNTVTASSCFVGSICGTATAATTVSTTDTTATDTDFNVTFTDGGGSGKILRVDTSKLAFNPSTNLLKIATGISACGGIVIGGVDGGASPITATLQYSPNGSGAGNVVVCLPESSGVLALTTDISGNANCLNGAPQCFYVMTCGNQTIAGVKTFSNAVCGSGLIRAVDLCATTSICGPLIVSSGVNRGANLCATTSICGPMVCVSGTVTGADICASANIRGTVICATNCFVGNFCGNATTATTAGNSNCLGGTPAACFVTTCGDQTVAGFKTFSSCRTVFGVGTVGVPTTCLVLKGYATGPATTVDYVIQTGTGTGGTFNLPQGTGTLALTSDTVNNANCLNGAPQCFYVMTCGDQTVAGVKTFSSTVCGSGLVRGANLCATTSICGPMVCVSGRVTGADICATSTICGPMVCVSGTVTAATLTSAGTVNVGTDIIPSGACLIVRTAGVIRACIDSVGICTPGTVRAAQICSLNSICGATLGISGNAVIGGNTIITGDLTVDGTTTTLNTTNLLVEDRYILLNSGSIGNVDKGGLIIDSGNGTGKAFILGEASGRWGFTGSLAQNATTATPDAFAAAVVTSDIVEYQKVGNIRISGEDIFIYS